VKHDLLIRLGGNEPVDLGRKGGREGGVGGVRSIFSFLGSRDIWVSL